MIYLTWQVESKLNAWISRRKGSDFEDLQFLFMTYREIIQEWSEHLQSDWRREFYEVFKVTAEKKLHKMMREVLHLEKDGETAPTP